jgi:hypothetical protein
VASTCRDKKKGHTGLWWENLKERDHLEDLNADGKMISKYIFKNYNRWGEAWTGLIWLRTGTQRALVNRVINLRVP